MHRLLRLCGYPEEDSLMNRCLVRAGGSFREPSPSPLPLLSLFVWEVEVRHLLRPLHEAAHSTFSGTFLSFLVVPESEEVEWWKGDPALPEEEREPWIGSPTLRSLLFKPAHICVSCAGF